MALVQSRRFWILMLDTVVSVALHYWGGPDTQFIITALQPVFLMIIGAYTVEGTAKIKADALPKG